MAGNRAMGSKLILKKGATDAEDITIASLTSIGELGGETEEIDTTTLDSPEGANESDPGNTDFGSLSLAGNITDDAQVLKFQELLLAKDQRMWQIEHNPSSGQAKGLLADFKGYVSSFKLGELTPSGLRTFTATIRISGAPTLTKGA